MVNNLMKKKEMSYLYLKSHILKSLIFKCLCLTSLQLKAVEDSKEQTITLEISKGTISEAFSAIEKQSNFKFFYNSDQVDLNKTINIKTKASSIESKHPVKPVL